MRRDRDRKNVHEPIKISKAQETNRPFPLKPAKTKTNDVNG